jgi:asparagine synthetase B (glutamine-hydrolysing)
MSGVAAAVRFDGGPAPISELETMIAAAPHRRPDGCTIWRGAGAALAKLHRLSLPEQSLSAQPAIDPSGLVAIFDGRLDNRGELAARFSAAQLRRDDDDVRYAVAALTARGPAGVEWLDGDFVLVAWDPTTRALVAASDALGLRPLYWMVAGGVLLLANDLAQVLAAASTPPPPDDTAITDILLSDPPIDGRTLYAGVSRLLPGECLRADGGGIRTTRYWTPEARPPDRQRSDDDYAEECRALLGGDPARRSPSSSRAASIPHRCWHPRSAPAPIASGSFRCRLTIANRRAKSGDTGRRSPRTIASIMSSSSPIRWILRPISSRPCGGACRRTFRLSFSAESRAAPPPNAVVAWC